VIPVCYAYIKNGTVIDVAVFNDPSDELLTHFIKEFDLDDIVIANEFTFINGTYNKDTNLFTPIKPYDDFVGIFNYELKQWEETV
jgi:hypothetical protein